MMISSTPIKMSAAAGILAAGLAAWAPAASGGSPDPAEVRQTQYLPRQTISHTFGSKFMSGYFVEHASRCLVTLMLVERSDPDAPLPISAARLRLVLHPGLVAGLDSEEGQSLNLTCGENAARLSVDAGERDKLVAQQRHAVTTEIAKAR